MLPNQDKINKKITNIVKNKLSVNTILAGREKLKPQDSRSKENLHKRELRQSAQNIVYHKTIAPSFKSIKNTQKIKVLNENTNNNQTIQPLVQQKSQTITFHVNIQNNTNITDFKKQRSMVSLKNNQKYSKEDLKQGKIKSQKQKSKKNLNLNGLDQFQCNEELELNIPSNNGCGIGLGKLEKKISQKKPLISYTDKLQVSSHINQKQFKPSIINAKSPKIIASEEIKEFENTQAAINIEAQSQMLMKVSERQKAYMVDSLYIEKNQKNLTWIMRAILIDWMMHVNSQFALKRQTFHISVILTDNFMTKVNNLPKSDFQLVGAASMFIASKLQQFQPLSSKQFAKSTNGRYSAVKIKQMQQKICKTLKFQLNPPTMYMWANRYMSQWDRYLEETQTGQNHPLFKRYKKSEKHYFKQTSDQSYRNFRVVMQLIDCTMLDVQTYQYRPQILVCSFMYLVLGKQLNGFTNKQIAADFPRSSLYLLNQQNLYNDFFKSFVEESFGYLLVDLLPTVQYSATYFKLPIILDPPSCKSQQQNNDELGFEQYCSFQTYNSKQLQIIKKRQRGIYQYEYQ